MIAKVIVDITNQEVDKIFDYAVEPNQSVQKGSWVTVPFGSRLVAGFVIGLSNETSVPSAQLKSITLVREEFQISEELVDLCLYLKNAFYLKMIDCLRLCVPSVVRGGLKAKTEQWVCLNPSNEVVEHFFKTVAKNAKNLLACVTTLGNAGKMNLPDCRAKFGHATIQKLLQEQVLVVSTTMLNRQPLSHLSVPENNDLVLTQEQTVATQAIISAHDQTFLLHGVTGSGKTEVYLQVIASVLKNDQTAIMLVPEISLTPQMVSRFRNRFGDLVAVLHSGLTEGQRRDEWYKLYTGSARVVVGARSAVFAPVKNVGVIIIDEEHDGSYISDNNPRYATLDVAQFRSHYHHCPLVLGSATPSISSYYLAKKGTYQLLQLPTRVGGQSLPPIEIVDMLPEFRGGNHSPFSHALMRELEMVVAHHKQAILFVNRRGFASFLMCRDCGYIPICEQCDVPLVYHKQDDELKCHYCGKRYKALTVCPKCHSKNIKLGGIGTERVVAELKTLFPQVTILRMDNDTTQNKDAYGEILQTFSRTSPCIMVGTQMIAKGHDFPNVELVGILDADLSLYFGSYRSAENTFQLITQVSGRAGRSKSGGKVILQTYFPKHYVYHLVANYDYPRFYEKEINLREVTAYPPFTTLLRVLLTSPNDELAKQVTNELFMRFKQLKEKFPTWNFLEAMRSPVNKIKNKYRYQIVLRFAQSDEIMQQIYATCDTIKQKDLTIFIELNPQNLT